MTQRLGSLNITVLNSPVLIRKGCTSKILALSNVKEASLQHQIGERNMQ